MKESSGTLLYVRSGKRWKVLIVRPSGPAARFGWSIPKGLPDKGESLEDAARRETREETGCEPGELHYLGHVEYRKSRKRVHGYAGPAPDGEPVAASWEVGEARFVFLSEAEALLHPDQRPLVDLLRKHLATR